MDNKTKDKKISLCIIALIIIVSPILIWKSGYFKKNDQDFIFVQGKVLEINDEVLQEDSIIPGRYVGYQQLKVEILEGTYKDQCYNIKNTLSRIYNVKAEAGMKIILRLYETEGKLKDMTIENYRRDRIIITLLVLFFIALVVFGGIKGVKSIISLTFTAIMIIFFMLPLLFKGYDPSIVSILTVTVTTIITLLLVSGYNKKTLVSILGTVIGVIIAGIISSVAGNLARLSGITMNEADQLIVIAEKMSVKIDGLMFSAILIASLGAIMDVAVTISSSIFEMQSIDKSRSFRALLNSGMNVGKDVMGTMSNTLILAFVGSSLNLLILIVAYKMPYNQLINADVVGIEMIQALAGSIGIVLTVPITALIATYYSRKKVNNN